MMRSIAAPTSASAAVLRLRGLNQLSNG
jgi:hypothetical protein